MNLINDFKLEIATAHTRMAKHWTNKEVKWSSLVERCSRPERTSETVAEYARMNREEQGAIKDVGGFVTAYLKNGKRKKANVAHRSAVTLDLDFAVPGWWDRFKERHNIAGLMYSTHKSTPETPRHRAVFPSDRAMTVEEYEPVARRLAEWAGLNMCDTTTFDRERLFYWGSVSKDGEWEFDYIDAKPFSVDEVLATYRDWRDVSEWPLADREGEILQRDIKKAGDPHCKVGLIGAFCRSYSIEDVIEDLLSDYYEPTAQEGRYTYKRGNTAGGVITFEGKFAYSYHDHDPAGHQLCNAFDLCRIQLFGARDADARTSDPTKMPSYLAMIEYAKQDSKAGTALIKERRASIESDFGGIDLSENVENDAVHDEAHKPDGGWLALLTTDKNGEVQCTINNAVTVMEYDSAIRGRLHYDEMRKCITVTGSLPWGSDSKYWSNSDEANLRAWLERAYAITGKEKIRDAVDVVVSRHRFHPIRDYLKGLEWDGVPRLERALIDYLGAEDSAINRKLSVIHFCAAVARVFEPGCKYDMCLILAGPQGAGKSTFINIMFGEYYKDGLTSMEGKEGAEQLKGSWGVEIGELEAMKRSEVAQVKQFITSRVDEYRPAYAQHKERFERQNVFWGTTNEQYILKDETGNRRFPVVAVNPAMSSMGESWFPVLQANRDQLWAEAVARYRAGQQLYLTKEEDAIMRASQKQYVDDDTEEMLGVLEQYLDTLVPADWDTYDLNRRRAYFRNPSPLDPEGVVQRDRVCVAEFLCERMGREVTDKEYRYLARKVAKLFPMLGWAGPVVSRHAEKIYGRQKSYMRPRPSMSEDI